LCRTAGAAARRKRRLQQKIGRLAGAADQCRIGAGTGWRRRPR